MNFRHGTRARADSDMLLENYVASAFQLQVVSKKVSIKIFILTYSLTEFTAFYFP